MKRVIGTALALAVVVLVVAIPAAFHDVATGSEDTAEETTITRYLAEFRVAADGSMSVTETITVAFPVYPDKRGIFRFWDLADPNAPGLRREPRDIAVARDGAPEPFELLAEDNGRYRVAKIGSADVVLDPGQHTYVISYVVDDVLIEADDHPSQLYWNLVPGGWRQPIEQARLRVELPAAAQDVRCAVGAGATGGCTATGEGTRSLQVRAGPLPPRTPVTLQAGLDQAVPPVQGTALPWAPRWDAVLGQSVPLLLLVLVAALAALVGGSVLGARSRETDPAFPLVYAPPEGIGPAQANFVRTETVPDDAFVASLLHAAERGAVGLEQQGRAWTISDKGGPAAWARLDEVTLQLAKLLPGPGTTFVADPHDVTAGKRLAARREKLEKATRDWATRSGLLVPSGLGGAGGLLVLGCLAAVLAVVIWNPFSMSAVGLVPGGFAIGAASLLRSGSGTRRTAAGRDLWSRVGGFYRVLSTPSARQRFDFSGREELYTAYIPWAVAFGCADTWAEKYHAETGHEPPAPDYVSGAWAGGHAGGLSAMVDSFSSTLDSAISSYEATQKSSSSGGGGFSGGGGGGGGGGGSW